MLERHGPYTTQAEAREAMDADPRPQAWLAEKGAMLFNNKRSPNWFVFKPPECEVPPK